MSETPKNANVICEQPLRTKHHHPPTPTATPSTHYIYTIYRLGRAGHVCIILEFTQNPGLSPDLGLAGQWMALKIVGWWADCGPGWRCAGIFTSTLEAMVDTGARASADCRQYEWSRETAENTTYDPLPTGYPPLVNIFHKCISCI